jgi:hypothetical protein
MAVAWWWCVGLDWAQRKASGTRAVLKLSHASRSPEAQAALEHALRKGRRDALE